MRANLALLLAAMSIALPAALATAAPQLCTVRHLLDPAVPNSFPGVPTRLR